MGRGDQGVYKLTLMGNGKQWVLSVPTSVGRRLADQGIMHFKFELTEDGLLYRPFVVNEEIPGWLKEKE